MLYSVWSNLAASRLQRHRKPTVRVGLGSRDFAPRFFQWGVCALGLPVALHGIFLGP